MRIRPRLLVASLVVAVAVIGVFVWIQWPDESGGDDVDARLYDPSAVVTYPNDGLGNDPVAGLVLPEATLSDVDGGDVSTAELLGEPLVVNLWYADCPPCAKELPDFAEVDAETDDVRFVGVNLRDSVERMEEFAGERGVAYDLLRDEDAAFTDAIGAVAFPVTLFVASDGTIVEQTGALDADQLRARIDDLLAAEAAAG